MLSTRDVSKVTGLDILVPALSNTADQLAAPLARLFQKCLTPEMDQCLEMCHSSGNPQEEKADIARKLQICIITLFSCTKYRKYNRQ